MNEDTRFLLLIFLCIAMVCTTLFGGCVATHYFTLEAAKIGLEPEGRGQNLRYVPTREF